MFGILFLPLVIFMAILKFIILGVATLFQMEKLKSRVWISLLALDQFANTLLGGSHKETISSRLGRNKVDGCIFCGVVCKFLDIFEKDHCIKSIERDINNGL